MLTVNRLTAENILTGYYKTTTSPTRMDRLIDEWKDAIIRLTKICLVHHQPLSTLLKRGVHLSSDRYKDVYFSLPSFSPPPIQDRN